MARSTTTAENDARLVSKEKEVNLPGFTLVRQWVYLDASTCDTLSVALDAIATYTNPKADGETYTGTFVNSKVEVLDDSKDGVRAPTIRQTLILVATITASTDLPADPIVTQENEIIDTLGIETGEADTMVYIYNNLNSADATRKACMDVTDAAYEALANVAANSPATGWIYADKKFEEKDDKTGRLIVIFKQVAWNAWGHDSYAADITVRDNIGSDSDTSAGGEVIGIRKTWLRIDKDDLATAVSDCESGTNATPTSGYVIMSVDVSDRADGSINISQTQVKSINNVAENGAIQLSPHALASGLTTNVVTVYRNFERGSLPSGSAPTEGGNIISNIPTIQGNGLWSREVVTRVPTWTGVFSTDKIRMSESNAGGYQLNELDEATGCPESTRATDWAAAQAVSDASTRVVTMSQLVERANGERVYRRSEQFASIDTTDDTALVIKIGANIGNRPATLGRVWWRRTATAKETLIGSGGAAVSNYQYPPTTGTTYLHTEVRVDDNGDGTYNVFQLASVPINNTSSFGGKQQVTVEIVWKEDNVVVNDNATGLPTKKNRIIYRNVFSGSVVATVAASALAYVDAGTGGSLIAIASTDYKDANGVTTHMGYVEFLGQDGSGNVSYAGYNVQLT